LRHVATENKSAVADAIFTIAYGNDIAKTVSEYARQHGAWLIVIGIQRAPILMSHVPDHIAYRVITEAPCSVLTIAFASKSHTIQAAACL
jgi:K+-sensing histidine kinase KdpD